MTTISAITAISVFLVSIFIYWWIMRSYSKEAIGEKVYKQWYSRLYFWQGAIFTGTGVTFLVMFVLKWAKILTF